MRLDRIGLAVARALLRALPEDCRDEYAEEMEEACVQGRRSVDDRASAAEVVRFWARELAGLSRAVAAAWLDRRRHPSEESRRWPREAPTALRRRDDLLRATAFDVRTTARGLLRRPVFLIAAVTAVALGIGGNTAVAGLGWTVLWQPLPWAEPERLVRVFHDTELSFGLSLNELLAYRERASTVDDLAGWVSGGATVMVDDRAERIVRARVTPNLFDLLRSRPLHGRFFVDDDVPTAVVLAHGYWTRRFASSPDAIGDVLVIDDEPHRVIGIAARGTDFPDASVDVYVHLEMRSERPPGRGPVFLDVVARLAPGVSVRQAQSEVEALATALRDADPASYEAEHEFAGRVVPLRESMVSEQRPLVLALMAATLVVFLATCLNIATLLAARSETRIGEMGVRRALGASAWDLARIHAVEGALITTLGSGAGVVLSLQAIEALEGMLPAGALPPGVGLGPEALVVAALGSAAAAALFTVVPLPAAFGARRGGGIAGVRSRLGERVGGLPGMLVAGQVTMALVLVSGSILLVRMAHDLASTDLGYAVSSVATARITLPSSRYSSDADERAFFTEVVASSRRLPGVRAVGVVNALPLSRTGGSGDLYIESVAPDSALDVVSQRIATPEYFDAMGIPLLAGRVFDQTDRENSRRVTLVDDAFARTFFGSPQAALGERIRFFFGGGEWNVVVGVVGHVRHAGPAVASGPQVYVPLAQRSTSAAHLVVAIDADADVPGLIASLRSHIATLDPAVPVHDVRTMEDRLRDAVARERVVLSVFVGFGLVALLLALAGVYGTVALTHRRTAAEVGIRRALGADAGSVLWSVAGGGIRSVASGVAVGLIGAVGVGSILRGMIHGVPVHHPGSIAGAALFLIVTGALAASLPAIRAVRADPARVLREE